MIWLVILSNLSKVWNGRFSILSWQSEAPPGIFGGWLFGKSGCLKILVVWKICLSRSSLDWNLQPAKAFPNKRMARPVPSVEFAHQVQGAMREKIRCREVYTKYTQTVHNKQMYIIHDMTTWKTMAQCFLLYSYVQILDNERQINLILV